MYDKAFREFDANNYEQALKDLDAIDARQPNLAESQNLRGVIAMRQKDYEAAETALRKALAADPKFWNARFNLAEVPFLQRNWAEARKRFQELLSDNANELQSEATQLIQYKILLTYLLEGKENMVDSMLAKFELSPETAAVHYANAALALNKKNETEAKDWLTRAEKTFSPQLNKLFAESLYTIGWLEKPAGQTRAAIELNSAADRAAKTKAFATAKFEQAEQALAQRDFTAARKLVDEADAAEPNQAPTLNLRGEILLEQKEYEQAEAEFRKAIKLDPKFRDAQYNLAQVPFKKQEYAKARERFEALFASTSGADKDQAAQLIKFKVYMTWLLEGKDARAQKMMEQFQFTGDTPALYYAQAAWEFKNNNPSKANDWVTSARKIYSPALNGIFSESLFDLGWLQSPAVAASAAPMVADAGQPESAPAIEPTPIPAITLAQTDKAKPSDPLTLAAQANSAVPGMEATTSTAEGSPAASAMVGASSDPALPTAALSPSVETPVASTASPAAARPVVASAPENTDAGDPAANATGVANAASTPATVLAPAKVREWSEPTMMENLERIDRNTLVMGALLLAAFMLLAWVVIPVIRRQFSRGSSSGAEPSYDSVEPAGAVEQFITPTRLAGGPPQVSLQLRASQPALRRGVMPLNKTGRPSSPNGAIAAGGAAAPAESFVEPQPYVAPQPTGFDEGVGEPMPTEAPVAAFAPAVEEPTPAVESLPADEAVGEPMFAAAETFEVPAPSSEASMPEATMMPAAVEVPESFAPVAEPLSVELPEAAYTAEPAAFTPPAQAADEFATEMPEAAAAVEFSPVSEETQEFTGSVTEAPEAQTFEPALPEPILPVSVEESAVAEQPMVDEFAPVEAEAQVFETAAAESAAPYEQPPVAETMQEVVAPMAMPEVAPMMAEAPALAMDEAQEVTEPIGQGQPIPYQTASAFEAAAPAVEPAAAEEVPEPTAETPQVESPKPQRRGFFGAALAGIGALRQSVATPAPAAEAESTEPPAQQSTTPAIMAQPTQPTPAPVIRTSPGAQMPGAAQQQPAPAMQPAAPQATGGAMQQPAGGMHTAVQLTFSFEIASLQLTPTFKMGALQLRPTSKVVTMRLAPSQHPQPAMNLQVTFEIASVQLNGNALGTVRLTPSQQQRPGMTSSPAFNIAGLQLVSGADAAPVQLTPAQQGQASVLVTAGFQIATVEFSPSFEIASIILNANSRNANVQLPGTGPSAVEGAPVFEISNVQLGGNGEISMMQLQPGGAGAKRA